MSSLSELVMPLPGANFGGIAALIPDGGAHEFVEAAEAEPETLPCFLVESRGLLLTQGMDAMADT